MSGVFTSPTNSIWTPRTTGALFPVTGVAISDERFVAVTWGEVLTSTTGASWTRTLIAPLTGPPYPNAVCAGDSKFVMVCSAGKAFETTDGVVCSPINLLTTSNINDVAFGAGAFVAVGDGGMVRVSGVVSVAPPKLSVSFDSSTVEVVILVTGQPGQSAMIEQAPSLTGWADLQQVTLDSGGSKTIRLPYDAGVSQGFFRVGDL